MLRPGHPDRPVLRPGLHGHRRLLRIFAYYYMPPRPTLMKARDAAAKALELDATLAEAHTSMAFVKQKLERDWAAAEQEYRRAIELDPEYIWAPHWYSLYPGRDGPAPGVVRPRSSGPSRSSRPRPRSPWSTAWLFYLARFYDRAVEELERAVGSEPQHVLATFYLGLAHLESGRYEEALALVERSVRARGQAPFFVQGIGYVHAIAGRQDLAEGVSRARLDEIMAKAYVSPVYMALIHFRLGESRPGLRVARQGLRRRRPLAGIHQGLSRLRQRPDRPALRRARREAGAQIGRNFHDEEDPVLDPCRPVPLGALGLSVEETGRPRSREGMVPLHQRLHVGDDLPQVPRSGPLRRQRRDRRERPPAGSSSSRRRSTGRPSGRARASSSSRRRAS